MHPKQENLRFSVKDMESMFLPLLTHCNWNCCLKYIKSLPFIIIIIIMCLNHFRGCY